MMNNDSDDINKQHIGAHYKSVLTGDIPRVLVSTVGAWSDSVGSNTMSSLFANYDKDKLACFYIRTDTSDSTSCDRYFHIIEGRVIKSIFNKKIATGVEYYRKDKHNKREKVDTSELSSEKSRYKFFSSLNLYFFKIIREIIWFLGNWKSRELDNFVDDFNPEVVIIPIESYIHFNRVNRYIIKRSKAKVIGFLWDDNFTYKQNPYNFWHVVHRWFLRRNVKKMVAMCEKVIALSPKMKRECDEFFNISSKVLTKPITNNHEFIHKETSKPIRIVYTGNLFVGRDKTLIEIVDVIRQVNKDEIKIMLDIYTGTHVSTKISKKLNVEGCSRLMGKIKQSEVLVKQHEADILLFVETTSKKRNQYARLSFSTKITDYFSAGRCIWAVGNSDMSAIDYLRENDAALISSDKHSIQEVLKKIVSNPSLVQEYAYKGYKCGVDNHNTDIIINKLNKMILEIYG